MGTQVLITSQGGVQVANLTTPVVEVALGSTTMTVVTAGIQGPPGPPGPPGSTITGFLASGAIGAQRLVVADGAGKVVYADCTELAHANAVVGMTEQAASANEPINILRNTWLTEPTWSWTPYQPVYLGLDGIPTQTLPAEAVFSMVVGFPVSATQLFIALREPVILT